MNQLISIIIPTYNRANLISDTLDSIIAQTYTNWECIIVDDGSTDDSFEVINKYVKKDSRFKLFIRPENKIKGANACRNFGFEKSSGDYILWFDSDDLLKKNALDYYINSFKVNTHVVVAKLELIDLITSKKIRENKIFSSNIVQDYIDGKIAFYISGPLWKKSFLNKQTELFDEKISNLDDWDFNLRMLYDNPTIVLIDKVLIQYRINENSLSKEISKLNLYEIKSEIFAREKHVKLLEINKLINSKSLKIFIKKRCKYFFRQAMVSNDKYKYYHLKILILKQLRLLNFFEIAKTLFGFIIFSIFKKGYKFLN